MSIGNAINLINDFESNPTLRNTIYAFEGYDELENFLKENGYSYTPDEFEDAVNFLHVKCQTLNSAQLLLEKAELLRYLLFIYSKVES